MSTTELIHAKKEKRQKTIVALSFLVVRPEAPSSVLAPFVAMLFAPFVAINATTILLEVPTTGRTWTGPAGGVWVEPKPEPSLREGQGARSS